MMTSLGWSFPNRRSTLRHSPDRSSRDWAAKGAALLGARSVLAVGFERIHRSNLINMGVLPIRLPSDITPETLALLPQDRVEVDADPAGLAPRSSIDVRILRRDGQSFSFKATAAIETSLEVEVLKAGGLLPMILARTVGEEGVTNRPWTMDLLSPAETRRQSGSR